MAVSAYTFFMCHDVQFFIFYFGKYIDCRNMHGVTHTQNLQDTFGVIVSTVGQDSSIGVATRHRLDFPDVECRWGRISAPVRIGPGAYPTSCTMGMGFLSQRVKWPGSGLDPPPV